MSKLAYNIEEAANAASVSVSTIRRAMRATDPKASPPPLRAKRIGTERKGTYLILAAELQQWLERLADA